MVGMDASHTDPDYLYGRACAAVFGVLTPRPARLFRIPFLGVEPAVLPEEAIPLLVQPSVSVSSAHDRVVAALAQACAPLTYAPQVPALSLILLQQLRWTESRTFAVVLALTRRAQISLAAILRGGPSLDGGGAQTDAVPTLALSREVEVAFVKAFRTILKGVAAPLSAHLECVNRVQARAQRMVETLPYHAAALLPQSFLTLTPHSYSHSYPHSQSDCVFSTTERCLRSWWKATVPVNRRRAL